MARWVVNASKELCIILITQSEIIPKIELKTT